MDVGIIIILLLFVLQGLRVPLILELLDLSSFIFSFLFSLKFYNLAATLINQLVETQLHLSPLPYSLAKVVGFMVVYFLVEIVFLGVSRVIFRWWGNKFIKFPGEPLATAILSVARGLIIVAVFLLLLATFPIQPKIKQEVNNSRLGSLILGKAYQLEAPLKGVFGELANDSLSFLTVKPATTDKVALGFTLNRAWIDPQLEDQMVELLNKERVKMGLGSLRLENSLREAARSHSEDMFKKGYFSHYSPEGRNVADRVGEVGVKFLVVGENLAYAPSLELAHRGLMGSPGHRANILSPDYGRVGVGVANGGEYGVMFVQVFAN